jgi:flagellar biosynthesis regulator FlbT
MKVTQISPKPSEWIFINGAVIRVDRKVSLELLDDLNFRLESHVPQAEEATTPLRQIYFVAQTMLMDPANAEATSDVFRNTHGLLSIPVGDRLSAHRTGAAADHPQLSLNSTFVNLRPVSTVRR